MSVSELLAGILLAGLVALGAWGCQPAAAGGTGSSSCHAENAGIGTRWHYLFGCTGDWDYCNEAWLRCYAERER